MVARVTCITLLITVTSISVYCEDVGTLLNQAESHYQMREQKEELHKAIAS